MNSHRINLSYAKALLMMAEERGVADRVAEDMRLVGRTCSENRELGVVFANPTVRYDKKTAIVQDLFADRVCEETLVFLRFVVRKNRSVHLKGISSVYLDLWREARNIVYSDLVTHQPIDEEARHLVTELIQGHTGKRVELNDRTDAKMIGGFKLEFAHNMYDARIRTKLRKLRMEFAKNEYESKL